MSDTPRSGAHHRPHVPGLADPFMEFDLTAEIERLEAEAAWSSGQNAKTLVKYDDLRVVLTVFRAGIRIADHKTEGRISIHALRGHLQVRGAGRTFSLRAGGLLALDQGVVHQMEAVEDSAFLLTIAWPGRA